MLRAPVHTVQRTAVRVAGVQVRGVSELINPVPTDFFQDSLPRMPIPKLENTIDRYVASITPLVESDEELAATTAFAQEFLAGEGAVLHDKLVKIDAMNKHTAFYSKDWYNMYLETRNPCPLYNTPQLTWNDDPNPEKMKQSVRAANIIASALKFHDAYYSKTLAPDVFHMSPAKSKSDWYELLLRTVVPRKLAFYYAYLVGGAFPLDMYQYERLYKSTRIPKRGRDVLQSTEHANHVVVMRGSKFYKLRVFDDEYNPIPVEEIEANIASILADDPAKHGLHVAACTATDRDMWADQRELMEKDGKNAKSLNDIDSALFVLTLDDSSPESPEELSRLMLHGECRDRWWDKCFNVLVAANGRSSITWEHSWGDGIAVLRFVEEVFADTNAMAVRPTVSPTESTPPQLEWNLGGSIGAGVRDAERYADDLIGGTELQIYRTSSLNKSDIKASGLSPDGVMQMALQLGHWRMHGYTPATYESATTAAFKHGRTETIRSATIEAQEFCKAFSNKDATTAEKFAALKAATDKHSAITREAMTGQGIDRHLFALRKLAEAEGIQSDFYNDPVYNRFVDIRLSTSTLSSKAIGAGGFGPISKTAYSVGYNVSDDGCDYHAMSCFLDTNGLMENVESALIDMRDVMRAAKAEE